MVQLIDLLDGGDYQTYNRSIARKFGSVSAAIMLSEIVKILKIIFLWTLRNGCFNMK